MCRRLDWVSASERETKVARIYVFTVPDGRLPKELLFGRVNGSRPAKLGLLSLCSNASVLQDCHSPMFCKHYKAKSNIANAGTQL